MRARAAFGLIVAVLLLCLPYGARGQDVPVIHVVGPPNDGYKAVYYAVRSGLFRKYGLNVQPTIVASGAAAAAALSGGAADVAYTNILTLIQAHTHNVPMVFVAPGALILADNPTTQTLVLKDSPIHTGHDMNGKTLGSSSLRDINAAATLAWVDQTGGDSKTVRVIEVPASAGEAFLEEHRADAVTLNEPAVTQALSSGKSRTLTHPYDAVGTRIQTAGFAAMEPYVEKNRDVMARFARAMHESSVYTNTHLPQTVDLVADYSGVTVDVVAHSARFIDAEYLQPKNLQPLIDMSAKYGLIDRDFPAQEIISSVAVKPR